MQLNNKQITSLESFQSNFNFSEAWHKIDVVIRDMSPEFIFYKDCIDLALYNGIKSPQSVIINNSLINLSNCCNKNEDKEKCEFKCNFEINKDENNNIVSLDNDDKIRAILLARLGKLDQVPPEFQSLSKHIKDSDNNVIVLTSGAGLKISTRKIKIGDNLTTKLIKVSSDSVCDSYVGKVKLEKGQYTYGVFCGEELIDVCPREAKNKSFKLEFGLRDNKPVLIVTDINNANSPMEFSNVHYYTLIGDDNFAIIENKSVRCIKNENLNNTINSRVMKILSPQIIKCENSKLYITYKNGSNISINLKNA